jgi:hypothetical protein
VVWPDPAQPLPTQQLDDDADADDADVGDHGSSGGGGRGPSAASDPRPRSERQVGLLHIFIHEKNRR